MLLLYFVVIFFEDRYHDQVAFSLAIPLFPMFEKIGEGEEILSAYCVIHLLVL